MCVSHRRFKLLFPVFWMHVSLKKPKVRVSLPALSFRFSRRPVIAFSSWHYESFPSPSLFPSLSFSLSLSPQAFPPVPFLSPPWQYQRSRPYRGRPKPSIPSHLARKSESCNSLHLIAAKYLITPPPTQSSQSFLHLLLLFIIIIIINAGNLPHLCKSSHSTFQ